MLKNLTIWRRFQSEISDSTLKRISETDCGFDSQEHYSALKNILSGQFPEQLKWEPKEVLALTSWNEYWEEGKQSCEDAYFCSVTLLACSEKKSNHDHLEGQVEKMIIAIDSSNLLGQGRTEELYEFFQYLLPKINIEGIEEDFLYFNLSTFILASMLNKPAEELEELTVHVLKAERNVAEYCQDDISPDIFSYTFFDQRINIWRRYYKKFARKLQKRRIDEFNFRTDGDTIFSDEC